MEKLKPLTKLGLNSSSSSKLKLGSKPQLQRLIPLLFLFLSGIFNNAFAAINPVSFTLTPSTGLPASTQIGGQYSALYTLRNNLPGAVTLTITKNTASTDVTYQDQCNGVRLSPNATCTIAVQFQPTVAQSLSVQLLLRYNRNVVIFPTLVSTTSADPSAELNGVIHNLPATTEVGVAYQNITFDIYNESASVVTPTSVVPSGFTISEDHCYPAPLAAGHHCSVTGSFTPISAGSYSVSLRYNYGSSGYLLVTGTTQAVTPQPPVRRIVGTVTPTALGNMIYNSSHIPMTFTFTNLGDETVTPSSAVLTGNTSELSNVVNHCSGMPVTINHACTITGTFIPTSAGAKSLTATFNYPPNPPVAVMTSGMAMATGTVEVQGSAALTLPATTYQYADNVVKFIFTNTGSTAAVLGAVSWSALLDGSAASTFTSANSGGANGVEDTCSNVTLAATNSCYVTAAISPTSTGSNLKITASLPVTQNTVTKTVTVNTQAQVIANDASNRMVTIVNQCPFNVWFTYNAGAAPDQPTGCPADPTKCCGNGAIQCPDANTECNTTASPHTCYWSNPSIAGLHHADGALQLAQPGVSADYISIPIAETNGGANSQDLVYNAGILPRTGCTGTGSALTCSVNTCPTDSNGLCVPGSGIVTPRGLTFNAAEFTFLRHYNQSPFYYTEDGVYDVQDIQGVNVPMEIKGRDTNNVGANPYHNCQPAGAAIQAAGSDLGSCSFNFSSPGVGDKTVYRYVTPGGGFCDSDADCTTDANGPMCGLAYFSSTNKINKACGQLIGFTSTNTGVCAQLTGAWGDDKSGNHLESSVYTTLFNCVTNAAYYSSTFGSALSCYTSPSTTCNGCINWWSEGLPVPTSPTTTICPMQSVTPPVAWNQNWINAVQPTIKWVKAACPTAYSYPYDDPSSSFRCTTRTSGVDSKIVTNYQVTFCPGGKTVKFS